MERRADKTRTTRETDVSVDLNVDGSGTVKLDTGIGFLDHLLEGFARHGYFDLKIGCKGDLEVDKHHTTEDIGLVLGQSFAEACGEKQGIRRFGTVHVPMDEALVRCCVDFSGRPYLNFDFACEECVVENFDGRLLGEFFKAFVNTSAVTLHLSLLEGEEPHHCMEAACKALGVACDEALSSEPRISGPPSSKGSLD